MLLYKVASEPSVWEAMLLKKKIEYSCVRERMISQSVTFPQALWEWLFDSRSHKACGNDVVIS